MWVCWRIRPNCVPDETAGCTLTMLYENTLRLNHTFTTPGVYCVDISVRNDISKMKTSFSINVKRSSEYTHRGTFRGPVKAENASILAVRAKCGTGSNNFSFQDEDVSGEKGTVQRKS